MIPYYYHCYGFFSLPLLIAVVFATLTHTITIIIISRAARFYATLIYDIATHYAFITSLRHTRYYAYAACFQRAFRFFQLRYARRYAMLDSH